MIDLPPELLDQIAEQLKTCKDLHRFCLANSGQICPIQLVKRLVMRKHKDINVDAMMYMLLCGILEGNETSDVGSYMNGTGIYQKKFNAMLEKERERDDARGGFPGFYHRVLRLYDLLVTRRFENGDLTPDEIHDNLRMIGWITDSTEVREDNDHPFLRELAQLDRRLTMMERKPRYEDLRADLLERIGAMERNEPLSDELGEPRRRRRRRTGYTVEDLRQELEDVEQSLTEMNDEVVEVNFDLLRRQFDSFIDSVLRGSDDFVKVNYVRHAGFDTGQPDAGERQQDDDVGPTPTARRRRN